MKNIHVLPTDKPSRLRYFCEKLEIMYAIPKKSDIVFQNIYITSDEKIKEGDWVIDNDYDKSLVYKADRLFFEIGKEAKKIILTTDQDLIQDGVQAIDDEFLEWFVKNQNCRKVDLEMKRDKWSEFEEKKSFIYKYKIIIPKEKMGKDNTMKYMLGFDSYDKSKQKSFENAKSFFINKINKAIKNSQGETLEEVNWKSVYEDSLNMQKCSNAGYESKILELQEQIKRMYSEEDLKLVFFSGCQSEIQIKPKIKCWEEWFEQFKKK